MKPSVEAKTVVTNLLEHWIKGKPYPGDETMSRVLCGKCGGQLYPTTRALPCICGLIKAIDGLRSFGYSYEPADGDTLRMKRPDDSVVREENFTSELDRLRG